MNAVVLAAGKGVRLRPLTDKKPKALVELAGKTLIERVLEELKKAGIAEVGIVTGYFGEMIQKKLGKEFKGMKLSYLKQEQQLGTANAIAVAKEFVGNEEFICVHTDVIAESKVFKELMEKFGKKKGAFSENMEILVDAAVVGREVKDPWRFGAFKIWGNRIVDIIEKPAVGEEPSKIINAGIYLFYPRIFEAIEKTGKSTRGEFEITDSLRKIAKAGRLGLVLYNGQCIDISSIEDLKEAEKILMDGKKAK